MKRVILSLIAGIALAGIVLAYMLVFKPKQELRVLAQETCDELAAAVMFQVPGIVNRGQGRANRLGFSDEQFSEIMVEECPSTMQSLREWAREQGKKI